ncbi:hypothetical protein ACF1A5_05375 [Streptomyces sp. NPDC014864]|uniref:hypothetical protein n=1 Tax=Streptomyces sp. NPDC014864 TaxID=3364924 RepID=UPI0036F98638
MNEDVKGGAVAAGQLARGAALREVVDVGDPGAWLALDEGVRADPWYLPAPYGLPPWETTEEGARLTAALRGAGRFTAALRGGARFGAALRGGGGLTESQLALALCHRDGRVRQRALRQAVGHRELLPLVVVRCADWAEPVREPARGHLSRALDAETAVRLTPLVLRVGRRSRGDFAVALVSEVLCRAPREQFAPLLADTDRAVRRFAYRLAAGQGLLSPAELARAAARDEDAVVQSLCAEAALTALAKGNVEDGDVDDVVGLLVGARSARARSAGVTALRGLGRTERAVGFLTDRSGLVRACARYVVRQLGGDPLAWYRERCADPTDDALPPGAAMGLAECGERADAALLWPLLDHPAARVRAQAVAGLRTLDATDVARMRLLLDDPAPGVVGEATLALLPSAELLPEHWLMERLGTERPRWVRVSAYRLLDARGGAARLRAARRLLGDADERLRSRAELTVGRSLPSS